jgi:hypothetical protein
MPRSLQDNWPAFGGFEIGPPQADWIFFSNPHAHSMIDTFALFHYHC